MAFLLAMQSQRFCIFFFLRYVTILPTVPLIETIRLLTSKSPSWPSYGQHVSVSTSPSATILFCSLLIENILICNVSLYKIGLPNLTR